MNQVANKLGLNPEANEESILSEIDSIVNKKTSMEEKMKKLEAEYEAAMEKCNELKQKLAEAEDTLASEKKAKAESEAEGKKEAAKNMVNLFVKQGKIRTESADKWTEKALADFDGVKNLLEELPANGKAVALPVQNPVSDAELTMVAAKAMQEVRNKLQIK